MSLILVVDDTASLRDEIADILRFEGYEVATAENGRLGLERAAELHPDLIVCDVMMPELDGYGVVAGLRADPTLATTPCLLLTARAERDDVRHGMGVGADDYLTKPFAADELLAAVEAGLAKRERARLETERHVDELRNQLSLALPHELRTPLAAVLGYAELIQEARDELTLDDCRDLAGKIRRAAIRLHRLTENFVLYGQLELLCRTTAAGAPLPTSIATDLAVVGALAATIAGEYGRTAELGLAAPVRAAIEEQHLRKLAQELLDNACKFSPPDASITVRTSVAGERARLEITGGVGMQPEQIAQVGAFVQFDRDVKEQQGMGLGLAIAQRIVHLCAGSLAIECGDGGVVTVRVELPLAPFDAAATHDDARH